jgi:hypothetical protein
MCFAGVHKISSLRAGPSTDSDLASYLASQIRWITVNSNGVSREAAILDTVIRDVLTNRELASMREFYGCTQNTPVRYDHFPPGYEPSIPNYQFEPLSSTNLGSGPKFTISCGGIWTDQPIPNEIKEDFRMLQPFAPERGALLSIYGSGGATTNGNTIRAVMGACMIGYEIRPATNGWEAGLFGYIDP